MGMSVHGRVRACLVKSTSIPRFCTDIIPGMFLEFYILPQLLCFSISKGACNSLNPNTVITQWESYLHIGISEKMSSPRVLDTTIDSMRNDTQEIHLWRGSSWHIPVFVSAGRTYEEHSSNLLEILITKIRKLCARSQTETSLSPRTRTRTGACFKALAFSRSGR